METNYDRLSTEDGMKQLIFDAISRSDDCGLCKQYGFVEFPCKLCLVTIAAVDEFENRISKWLQEECE